MQPHHSDGTSGPLLDVRGLEKTITGGADRVDVLRGVDLTLAAGHSLALTGESGSGKSTLLHLVAGLDTADAGRIRLAGQEVGALSDAGRAGLRRDAVGLVFQQFNLIPSLRVAENLAFQARLAGRFDADRVAGLAARLGLEGLMHRYPEQLSGGQQQRVAIGRALAARPALVLADEPTGNLDEATGDAVLDLMLELVRDAGVALLMVTHSLRLAARCDARLHLRAGRVSPDLPPHDTAGPARAAGAAARGRADGGAAQGRADGGAAQLRADGGAAQLRADGATAQLRADGATSATPAEGRTPDRPAAGGAVPG